MDMSFLCPVLDILQSVVDSLLSFLNPLLELFGESIELNLAEIFGIDCSAE